MDTKLQNGDHAPDQRGIPARIGGAEEIRQRALIRLTVPKGSLGHLGLPAFGSELWRLPSVRPALLRQMARSYVQEALAPMRECAVSAVDVTRGRDGDALAVSVTLLCRGEANQLEVAIQ